MVSSNIKIRLAVVYYLSQIKIPKALFLLRQIKENDPNIDVRDAAIYRLQLLR